MTWSRTVIVVLLIMTQVCSFHNLSPLWSASLSPLAASRASESSHNKVEAPRKPLSSDISKSIKINKEIIRFFNEQMSDIQLQKLLLYVTSIENDMNQINVSCPNQCESLEAKQLTPTPAHPIQPTTAYNVNAPLQQAENRHLSCVRRANSV